MQIPNGIESVRSKFVSIESSFDRNQRGKYKTWTRIDPLRGLGPWTGTGGAFYYAKDSGNFGWNSNGKVRFGFF